MLKIYYGDIDNTTNNTTVPDHRDINGVCDGVDGAGNNNVGNKTDKTDSTGCRINAENYIFNPDAFFNNTYEDEWLTDPLTVQMIKDIDGSEVKGPRTIDSPFLGLIPTERLSGGVKTLILMNNDREHIFNASACGDNCAKWILKIAQDKDLLIRLGYLMDFGEQPFEIEIENLGLKVHNRKELVEAVLDNKLL